MNVLLVTPFLPDPDAAAGAPRAIYDRVRLLRREHRVTIVSLMEPGQEPRRRCAAEVGARVYAVTRSAALRRSTLAAWRRRLGLAAGMVARRPVLVQEFASARVCALLARLVREVHYDVVLVEHVLAAQYLDCLGTAAPPVVFTDHDVRASFPAGRMAQSGSLLRRLRLPLDLLDRALWRRYARRAYRSAAVVSVPTIEDERIVAAQAPGVRVEVLPFGMALPASAPESECERERDTLLFVGNYDHPPNRDAALWLGRDIMPLVWARRPEARLWLVGRNPTPEVRALASDRVTVTGEVPSVREYLGRCSIFVAPLRLGGGMRIKLIEALASGAPVVTTPVGARGLGAQPGKHLLVAETAREFADAVSCALDDSSLRARLGMAGRELAQGGFQEDERAAGLNALLDTVVGGGRS